MTKGLVSIKRLLGSGAFFWRGTTMKIAIGIALTALTVVSQAQYAGDNASNAPYVVGQEYIQVGTTAGDQTAATNGMNGGFGFEKWQRGGYGSPPNNGTTVISNINASFGMGAQQFSMTSGASGSEGADARRRLLSDLPVGSVFSFSMMAGGNGAGRANTSGFWGVEMRSSLLSNPGRDIFGIYGGPTGNWSVEGAGAAQNSGIAVTAGQRLDVSILTTAAGAFSVTLTPAGGTGSTFAVNSISAGAYLRTAQFFVFGTNGDFYMNNLQAVPEPGTFVALGIGVLAIARRRRATR
jgi:hypothetical protein